MIDIEVLKTKGRALRRGIYKRNYVGYGAMPHFAKLNALDHVFLPKAPVVETGTHRGDSSRYFASSGHAVHTIEVSESLSQAAFPGLRKDGIACYLGDSAVVLPQVLRLLKEQNIRELNLWLDGHWSGGITSTSPQYETPIIQELNAVASVRRDFEKLVVAIDDVRCFGNDKSYPDKRYLVDWAHANDLKFYFLADIFVASTQNYIDI